MILNGFYNKSQIEFIGYEIKYEFMTPEQLTFALKRSLDLYNKLYPPPPHRSLFGNLFKGVILTTVVGGIIALTGGTILAAMGTSLSQVMGVIGVAGNATAVQGGVMATIQSSASIISGTGMVYKTVTGKNPPGDLMKISNLITSKSAFTAMKKITVDQLGSRGVIIQKKDVKSNAIINEEIKREQLKMALKLKILANKESEKTGIPLSVENKFKLSTLLIPLFFVLVKKL